MVALRVCGGESERGGGGVSKKETNRRIGSLGLYERFGCVGHMGLHTRPLFLAYLFIFVLVSTYKDVQNHLTVQANGTLTW
ncbi:hypothetical protein VNO77_29856 [Canavalia gladiata]|uniref:Uncharacterized protein n=1 Tax=Canavalia gladiata TaxID=3824 RepID=A0AAN9KNW8_CANGL